MLTLSLKQKLAIGRSTGRVNLWHGSIRSGKTYSSLLAFLARLADPPPGGQIVITGKNADSIYRNVFAPIFTEKTLAFLQPHIHYRQGSVTARILGHIVHIIGANDGRAERRLRGMTVSLAYADEVTVLPEGFFKQLLGRMSPPGAQMFATTNPDSPTHWLKTEYLDRIDELPDWNAFLFTLDDNPTLSDEYKNAIKAEYTGLWYKRFILGQWVAAQGAVFDQYEPDTHVVNWDDTPPMRTLLAIGVDYGTTNPTAAITLGQDKQGRLWALDEMRIDETNRGQATWTDAQQSAAFTKWLEQPHHPSQELDPPRFILIDPAAASFKAQLTQDGHRNTRSANNSVLEGIKTMSTLFAKNKLYITTKCPGLIKELPGYTWDAKATEKGLDQPIKDADHSIDALRYAIYTTRSLWRRHLKDDNDTTSA